VIDFFSLIRIKVSLSIILSTTLGLVYGGNSVNYLYFLTIIAIFFLSSGCSVLNQIQEVNTDKRMERTKNRPLARNSLSMFKAFLVAYFFIIISLVILYFINLYVFSLGVLTIIIYNFLYTPLKLKTPYSILIGAFIGSIPPLIGYLALNNNLNYNIINICIIYYLWQIPHFWLITEQYKKDYKRINYPFLSEKLTKKIYHRIFIIWIVAYMLSILNILIIESIGSSMNIFWIPLIIIMIICAYIYNYNNIKKLYVYHNLILGVITILLIIKKII
jgi:protoheme IX farnesyltransferase